MKVVRNKTQERWLLDKIKEYLDKQPRSEGYHVSDLLALRKAYWKRIDPKPMTDHEAGYFVAGRGHHEVIEAIITGSDKASRPDAGEFKWKNIWYSPDLKLPHPVEIKTTRAKFCPKENFEKGYELYLKQLACYMAAENDGKGALIVFYLSLEQPGTRSTKPEFRWYNISMTKTELEDTRRSMSRGVKALDVALKTEDQSRLELCPVWMCPDCQWVYQCQPWVTDDKRNWVKKRIETK